MQETHICTVFLIIWMTHLNVFLTPMINLMHSSQLFMYRDVNSAQKWMQLLNTTWMRFRLMWFPNENKVYYFCIIVIKATTIVLYWRRYLLMTNQQLWSICKCMITLRNIWTLDETRCTSVQIYNIICQKTTCSGGVNHLNRKNLNAGSQRNTFSGVQVGKVVNQKGQKGTLPWIWINIENKRKS